jgi:RNA polymerase-binding transcription factor DksA
MARKPRDQQRADAERIPPAGSGKLDATRPAATPPPAPRKRRGRARPSPRQIRERLLGERAAATAELAQLGVALERDESVGPGESPFEEGDVAQASERRDMAFMQRERLAGRIDRLTRALERLASGTYGVCEECGRAIDPARLAALPEVAVCRECQERRERGQAA